MCLCVCACVWTSKHTLTYTHECTHTHTHMKQNKKERKKERIRKEKKNAVKKGEGTIPENKQVGPPSPPLPPSMPPQFTANHPLCLVRGEGRGAGLCLRGRKEFKNTLSLSLSVIPSTESLIIISQNTIFSYFFSFAPLYFPYFLVLSSLQVVFSFCMIVVVVYFHYLVGFFIVFRQRWRRDGKRCGGGGGRR